MPTSEAGKVSGIPIRNIWLLMLYASDLFRQSERTSYVSAEENPDDIPDLVAEVLAHAVERRLRRNLTYGYESEHAVLTRVRGRIDVLTTMADKLLARGMIACDYQHLTVDTPRNQYVRAALDGIARIVGRRDLARKCRTLVLSLERLGVSKRVPSRIEISTMRFSRHDREDQLMVAAARLAFEIALPSEAGGGTAILAPDRSDTWMRRLYEKAIGGFYEVVLSPLGWQVETGRYLRWPVDDATEGIEALLPSMQLDIALTQAATKRRIIIDTKFTSVLTYGRFGQETLKSGYLYQVYAYLRSQEGQGDACADHAEGVLLHPSVGTMVDESAWVQGHRLRAVTVDLAESADVIRSQLMRVVD
ncbi:MAG: 5-methylcytosine-specific restriction endonuclease system specificity protein McrC [Phycisphaeraceae bacterium]|nr:5-methylcytosine-specific restriction endonuclease system specificity protein McrC [Phycisphaeraceae bacterium]